MIGAAGDLVQTENFLAILEAERDEEGNLQPESGAAPSSPTSTSLDVVPKTEGLIVFFPGKFYFSVKRFQDICLISTLDFELFSIIRITVTLVIFLTA